MNAAQIIWLVTLVIIAVVIVPFAVALLKRAWRAASSIEHYLSDMREASAGIAHHGSAIEGLADCAAKAERLAGDRRGSEGRP